MPYTAYASDYVISATELWVVINGYADDPPAGYDTYCQYLVAWELVDSSGKHMPGCRVQLSYQNGMQPAHEGIDGKLWCGYTPMYLHLILGSKGQPAGDYTFRFTLESVPAGWTTLGGGGIQTLEIPLFIAQKPLRVASDCTHPIPGMASWQQKMIKLADKWMPELLNPDNALGADNYYYDIASTYLEAGQYIHNSMKYWDVAYNSACRYREYLLGDCQPPGAAAPWSVFPRGIRQMFESTHDSSWADLLKSMTSGGWVACAGSPDPMLMRETAYAADVWIELEWIEAGNREMLQRAISYLLTQFNLLCAQHFGKGEGMVCQPFFFGLAMQSLIDYYDFVADSRIPQALIGTCAWLWENAVNAKTGYVKYDVWAGNESHTGLNPMMYNAWGFLYNVTGNDLYRQQGDILFEHQFDDGAWSWSPKQFAQIYRRSTDYVTRWRASEANLQVFIPAVSVAVG